jgi:hypothetical protein
MLGSRYGYGLMMLQPYAYLSGGYDLVSLKQDMDRYDMGADSWTARSTMPSPARNNSASAAVSGSSAGWSTGGQQSARMLDHDEYIENSWTSRTDLPADARMWAAAAQC